MLSFFPRDVLDEILNLIEAVSEGFPSYFYLELRIWSGNSANSFLFPLVANNAIMSCIRQIVAILCFFNFLYYCVKEDAIYKST